MSLLTSSSGIIINGGNFTSISLPTQDAAGATQVLGKRKDLASDSCESDDHAQADDLRKRRRCRSLDGLMIVKADEFDLHTELIRGIGYRIHSASHHGRLVAVKTFEGFRAEQDWAVDVAFSKEFLHSNVLKIVGASADERSKSHFILFQGITSEQKMQSLIAKALRTDLNMSVRLSMKAVKGIAAGLSYIKSQNIPMYLGAMNNNRKWENFNIFTGYNDEPMISFDPSSTVHENGSVLQTFDNEMDGCGVEVLSGLCQQLFSRANSILYDDSPEREFDAYDRESFPRAPLEEAEGTSNVSEIEGSTEKPKSCPTPRREVWWVDLGAKNQSLESIKRHFEDCLDRFLLSSSSNSLLRHITSPTDSKLRHNLHQCPGYLREEITLASDMSKSVIISHTFPSQSEVCSICGQLVQYKCTEPPIIDGEKQEANSPNGSKSLPAILAAPQSDVREMVTPSHDLSPDLINPYLSTPHYSTMVTGPIGATLLPLFPEWEDAQESVAEPKSLDSSASIDMTPTFPLQVLDSHHLRRLQPSGIPAPHSPVAGPLPVLLDTSDSDSTWIPPSPELSNDSGRRFNPFDFDMNSLSTWSSPPLASQNAQLDDLFTSYLNTMNLTDFSMQSQSSASANPVPHDIATPFRYGTSQTSSSSPPLAAPQACKCSVDNGSLVREKAHSRSKMLEELISSSGSSPFASGTLQSASEPSITIPCGFPKSDENIEVLTAWKRITSDPKFKDVDISSLCSEFTAKAHCDGSRVVLEPQAFHSILVTLSNKQ